MSYATMNPGVQFFGALGDEYADQMACLNKANNSRQVKAIDAIVMDLSKNWNPTGYFRPDDVQRLLDMFAIEAEAAGNALKNAPLSTSDAEASKRQAFEDMLRKYLDRSRPFAAAVAAAKKSGSTVINAPALKNWVLSSMMSISDAYVTATVLHCRQTWVEKWLDKAYSGMASIGGVAAKIIGVAVRAGESVIDMVTGAGKIIGFALKAAPYIAGAVVVYVGYTWIKKAGDLGPGETYKRVSAAGSSAHQRARGFFQKKT